MCVDGLWLKDSDGQCFLGGEGLPADDFMILALSDGKVVGYIWGGLNEPHAGYRGEIRQIYLSPEYQRHGIGRLLVCQRIHCFAERNVHSLCVWTLKINPNRAFYERIGAVFVREFLYEAENFTEPGWIYGWTDTSPLLKFCDSPS